MVMHQLGSGHALDLVSCSPEAGTEIDILHVEEIALVHSLNLLKCGTSDDKAGPHDPFRVEWLTGLPGVHHQVLLATLRHHRPDPVHPPGEDVEHRVEAAGRILSATVGIDQVQPD